MKPIVFFYTATHEKQIIAFGKDVDKAIPSKEFLDSLLKKHPEYKKENLYLWYQNTSFLIVKATD